MKQRSVAIVAEYLSHRPIGRIVGLKSIGDDDYVLASKIAATDEPTLRGRRVRSGTAPHVPTCGGRLVQLGGSCSSRAQALSVDQRCSSPRAQRGERAQRG
ncbi:MAG: hypothetical protein M3198_16565 [Actinomycetota bacterium]|nr:hypothetical protein [Actinomycetota bacterium]